MFSARVWFPEVNTTLGVPEPRYVVVQATVTENWQPDWVIGPVAYPGTVIFHRETTHIRGYAHTHMIILRVLSSSTCQNVTAGIYDVEMRWQLDRPGGEVFAGPRTLTVLAVPEV